MNKSSHRLNRVACVVSLVAFSFFAIGAYAVHPAMHRHANDGFHARHACHGAPGPAISRVNDHHCPICEHLAHIQGVTPNGFLFLWPWESPEKQFFAFISKITIAIFSPIVARAPPL